MVHVTYEFPTDQIIHQQKIDGYIYITRERIFYKN
jgi:hypothetical protein